MFYCFKAFHYLPPEALLYRSHHVPKSVLLQPTQLPEHPVLVYRLHDPPKLFLCLLYNLGFQCSTHRNTHTHSAVNPLYFKNQRSDAGRQPTEAGKPAAIGGRPASDL